MTPLNTIYGTLKTKILAFISGAFAVLSFLYANEPNLFIPEERYGQIFYLLGIIMYLTAMFILFLAAQPVPWILATEVKTLKTRKFDDYLEYLHYQQDEYLEAVKQNSQQCEKKQKSLNLASLLLVLGGILLLVIKIFN